MPQDPKDRKDSSAPPPVKAQGRVTEPEELSEEELSKVCGGCMVSGFASPGPAAAKNVLL